MTSDRPYGQALSIDAALAELEECAGTQFDPAVVEAFLAEIGPAVPDRPVESRQTEKTNPRPAAKVY